MPIEQMWDLICVLSGVIIVNSLGKKESLGPLRKFHKALCTAGMKLLSSLEPVDGYSMKVKFIFDQPHSNTFIIHK